MLGVQAHDADVMDHLVLDGHRIPTLLEHDVVVVKAGTDHRAEITDAPLAEPTRFGIVVHAGRVGGSLAWLSRFILRIDLSPGALALQVDGNLAIRVVKSEVRGCPCTRITVLPGSVNTEL